MKNKQTTKVSKKTKEVYIESQGKKVKRYRKLVRNGAFDNSVYFDVAPEQLSIARKTVGLLPSELARAFYFKNGEITKYELGEDIPEEATRRIENWVVDVLKLRGNQDVG